MTTTPILPGITSSFIDTPRRAHVRRCGRARSQVGRGRPGVRGAQIRHGRVRRGTGRVHAGAPGALQSAQACGVSGRAADLGRGEDLEAGVAGMELEDYFSFLTPDDIRVKGTRIGIETVLDDYLNGGRLPGALARILRLGLGGVAAQLRAVCARDAEPVAARKRAGVG